MSLTDLNSRETVTAFQIWLEVANGLKQLLSDPKALENQIRLAYELPAALQAKSAEAQSYIDKNQSLLDEQKKDLQDITKKLVDNEDQRKALEVIQVGIDKDNITLETGRKLLKADQTQLSSDRKTLQEDRNKLEAEKAANLEFSTSLDAREKKIDQYEASLKAREDKLKEIIGGA